MWLVQVPVYKKPLCIQESDLPLYTHMSHNQNPSGMSFSSTFRSVIFPDGHYHFPAEIHSLIIQL